SGGVGGPGEAAAVELRRRGRDVGCLPVAAGALAVAGERQAGRDTTGGGGDASCREPAGASGTERSQTSAEAEVADAAAGAAACGTAVRHRAVSNKEER